MLTLAALGNTARVNAAFQIADILTLRGDPEGDGISDFADSGAG
jgi:hypothetical protein